MSISGVGVSTVDNGFSARGTSSGGVTVWLFFFVGGYGTAGVTVTFTFDPAGAVLWFCLAALPGLFGPCNAMSVLLEALVCGCWLTALSVSFGLWSPVRFLPCSSSLDCSWPCGRRPGRGTNTRRGFCRQAAVPGGMQIRGCHFTAAVPGGVKVRSALLACHGDLCGHQVAGTSSPGTDDTGWHLVAGALATAFSCFTIELGDFASSNVMFDG